MQTRRFGRLGWQVSEVGYGMWGMGGWSGSDDAQSLASLDQSVAAGVNFYDTAWAYGDGHSEQLLAQTLRAHDGRKLYVATKVPPKNRKWPGTAATPVSEVFPYDYIVEMTEKSLQNLGVERLDLQQLHVWDDAWAADEGWQRAAEDLKAQGKIEGFGISVNRWQPANVLQALETRQGRCGAGRLQRLRPEPGGRTLPRRPAPRRRDHRARAVRRRQPHRQDDPRHDVPEERLAQPLLHAREPARDARPRRRPAARTYRPG